MTLLSGELCRMRHRLQIESSPGELSHCVFRKLEGRGRSGDCGYSVCTLCCKQVVTACTPWYSIKARLLTGILPPQAQQMIIRARLDATSPVGGWLGLCKCDAED